MYYWPTPAPSQIASSTALAPRVANSTATSDSTGSTLVNSAGFKLYVLSREMESQNTNLFPSVSPSIYVAFESLRAKDLCGTVGPTFTSTTLAFDPTDLSTYTGWQWDTAAYSSHEPVFYYPTPTFTQASWGNE